MREVWFCILLIAAVSALWGVLIFKLIREIDALKEELKDAQHDAVVEHERNSFRQATVNRLLKRVCQLERVTVKRENISALAAWYNATNDDDDEDDD